MSASSTYFAIVWTCCCIGAALIAVPALALGIGTGAAPRAETAGRAFVLAWVTIAVLVPALAAIRGFNWATALLVCALAPVALWLARHRGEPREAFNRLVRGLVLGVVTARADHARTKRLAILAAWLLAAVGALLVTAVSSGPRLTVPADFDILWRTRQLLSGSVSWDPLAALSAVVARIASVEALLAVVAVRICLIAATGCAAGLALSRLAGRNTVLAAVAMPVVFLVPSVSLDLWVVALLAIIGAGALVRLVHARERREGWAALAAGALAIAHLAHCADPGTMWRQARQTALLEHPAAAVETLRLAHASPSDDWILAAPPEQALELDGRGHFQDLRQFVSRFRGQTGRPDFRFDLPVKRLYVIVEKQPLNVSRAVVGVRFIDAQPAAYRVQSERARLERDAQRLCDDYRRAHSGAGIVYDDVALRIYQFDI
jgi:hypothetical protein